MPIMISAEEVWSFTTIFCTPLLHSSSNADAGGLESEPKKIISTLCMIGIEDENVGDEKSRDEKNYKFHPHTAGIESAFFSDQTSRNTSTWLLSNQFITFFFIVWDFSNIVKARIFFLAICWNSQNSALILSNNKKWSLTWLNHLSKDNSYLKK